jgi:S-DNA-T family DNA segregation ATPase FtsK/SpoIIIE
LALHIPTRHLVALLTDLEHTAAGPEVGEATAAILLHTARGELKGEPGKTDLLVGTSTDRYIVGHTFVECYGQIAPMLWPINDVRTVLAVLKPMAKIKEHVVVIELVGTAISVAEDADLFGERSRYTFTGLDATEFPSRGVHGLLTSTRRLPAEKDAPDAAPRTDFAAHLLAPFLKVATRRGTKLEMYRHHQNMPISIQIGPEYRGVLRPAHWEDDDPTGGNAPNGDVHPIILEPEGA